MSADTTVPEGSGVADVTVRAPSAVPPVGGITAGSTRLRLVAADGSSTIARPPSMSPGAGTVSGGSTTSGTTSA